MPHQLTVTPTGHLVLLEQGSGLESAAIAKPIAAAFEQSAAAGLLYLATSALQASLPPDLEFCRAFARTYLTRLCQCETHENALPPTPPPASLELSFLVVQAPPMAGLEYLSEEALAGWWTDLDAHVRDEIKHHPAGRKPTSVRKTRNGGLSDASRCTWRKTSATGSIRSRSWRLMPAVCRRRVAFSTNRWGGRCSNTQATTTGKLFWVFWFPCRERPSAAIW